MDRIDAELAALEALQPEQLRALQLNVLSTTYPGWHISYGYDPTGRLWWVARLVGPLTPAMETAGVLAHLQRSNCIALASALAMQMSYLRLSQPATPPAPRALDSRPAAVTAWTLGGPGSSPATPPKEVRTHGHNDGRPARRRGRHRAP
ncbi:hypothetical protein [Nonomuraea angiospora]